MEKLVIIPTYNEKENIASIIEVVFSLHQQFHVLIARAAHNEFLAETLEWLYGHVLRLWNLALHRVDSLNQAVGEHSAIFEAIQAKDGARAAELMRAHVIHFQQEFSKF